MAHMGSGPMSLDNRKLLTNQGGMNMKTATAKKEAFKCKSCGMTSDTPKKCCGAAMEKNK